MDSLSFCSNSWCYYTFLFLFFYIPIFIVFLGAGIPFGVAMAFLITSPMINEVAILVFASAVGWDVATIYIVTGMSIGLLGGFFMDKLGFAKYLEQYKLEQEDEAEIYQKRTLKEHLLLVWEEALDIIKAVWLYVVVGIGIGATLHGYVPESFFAQYAGADLGMQYRWQYWQVFLYMQINGCYSYC